MGEGDKVYTLVLKVDLSCCSCRKQISKYLCRIKHKENIEKTEYDEKKNEVRISGPLYCPEELKRKLLCKFPKEIRCIEIIAPKKPDPKPKDELKEKFMKKCTEEYEQVKKCIDRCKEDCEEKYLERFNCKCKSECKSKCKCSDGDETPPEPKPETPKPAPCPSDFVVCCASPCPCFVVWANNYQCCTCGVVCWPKWSGPGCGMRPGPLQWDCVPIRPQWDCVPIRPQWDCQPSRPQWDCVPSRPQWECQPIRPQWDCQPSRPKWGCDQSRPRPGCDPCQPNVVIESSPCSIM